MWQQQWAEQDVEKHTVAQYILKVAPLTNHRGTQGGQTTTMDISFELTQQQKGNLRRIRALRDIPFHRVRKGDLGGWVASTHTTNGEPRIASNAWLGGEAELHDDASLRDSALMKGYATAHDHAVIAGGATVRGEAVIGENAQVRGRACVQGKARVFGDAIVTGRAHVFGAVKVYGFTTIGESARVFGNADLDGPRIMGCARVWNNALISGDVTISGHGQVTKQNHYLAIHNCAAVTAGLITVYPNRSDETVFHFSNAEHSVAELEELRQKYETAQDTRALAQQVQGMLQFVRSCAIDWGK